MSILPLPSRSRGARAFTLVEILIVTAIGGMLMGAIMMTLKTSGTSFAAIGNYTDLDQKSRNAVDVMSKEIRNSSALTYAQTTNPKTLIFANATAGTTFTITYDSGNRVLKLIKSGQVYTMLTGCDQWDFSLYSKAPNITSTNITFYGATNLAGQVDVTRCKLVNMTWKCSRAIFGSKRNTESIQTAEIVLRNKVN